MAVGPSGPALRAGEEEWKEAFERLQERFPTVPAHRVAQALREHNGHAGGAAAMLRDLTSSVVKEADPDDVEHVATLLSSPSMFKHACKEQFKKFDVNGDGVLEWVEVQALVQQLYEEFGLQIPSEGSLRAFFYATDENQDGVLSEREFRKFFEMFLRYAFFDHLKLRQMVEKGQAIEARRKSGVSENETYSFTATKEDEQDDPPSRTSSKPESEARSSHSKPPTPEDSRPAKAAPEEKKPGSSEGKRPSSGGKLSKTASAPALAPVKAPPNHRSPTAAGQDPRNRELPSATTSPQKERSERHRQKERHSKQPVDHAASPQFLRCTAPNGVAFRRSADYQDRRDAVLPNGATVRVLEHWVRTSDGWLPLFDPQGQTLFERGDPSDSKKRVSIAESSRSRDQAEKQQRKEATRPSEEEEEEPVIEPEVSRQAEGGGLKSNEEEWRPAFERLCQRFPSINPNKVVQALRENDGHAGKAASMLREL